MVFNENPYQLAIIPLWTVEGQSPRVGRMC